LSEAAHLRTVGIRAVGGDTLGVYRRGDEDEAEADAPK
jgi:hypothetical protein